jgi:hypothetical protein
MLWQMHLISASLTIAGWQRLRTASPKIALTIENPVSASERR